MQAKELIDAVRDIDHRIRETEQRSRDGEATSAARNDAVLEQNFRTAMEGALELFGK